VAPASVVAAGDVPATFTANATGSPWLYYGQWFSNGVAIAGASGPTYTTAPLTAANEGDAYTCLVSNFFSSALTLPVVVHVLPDLVC